MAKEPVSNKNFKLENGVYMAVANLGGNKSTVAMCTARPQIDGKCAKLKSDSICLSSTISWL